MKKAEEWWKEAHVNSSADWAGFKLWQVQEIQKDAERSGYERGVREAAECVKNNNAGVPVGNEMTFQDVADDFVRDILCLPATTLAA